MSRIFSMFSAGEGSFRASLVQRLRHPDVPMRLVFTDTLYEDADAYRFLIEAAAFVFDRRLNWSVRAEDFPDYRVPPDVPIEEYRGNADWRAFLADLRARAMDAIPELVWLVEGRDPWETFRDRSFLGNSGVDPCSEALKRIVFADWRSAHCYREGELFGPADTFIVGIGDHEAHRFDNGKGGGIGPRNAKDGWRYEAPLLTAVRAGEYGVFYAPVEALGIVPARLYALGYVHNNCGGFCCKAGQAHYQNRFRVQPDRYAYDAMMEEKIRAYLDADVAMLTDRRGGDKKPLTLNAFAGRMRAEPNTIYDYEPGDSGCACFTEAA